MDKISHLLKKWNKLYQKQKGCNIMKGGSHVERKLRDETSAGVCALKPARRQGASAAARARLNGHFVNDRIFANWRLGNLPLLARMPGVMGRSIEAEPFGNSMATSSRLPGLAIRQSSWQAHVDTVRVDINYFCTPTCAHASRQ